MSYREPPNLPPLPDKMPPFPSNPPLGVPLVELVGWWLHAKCPCGRSTSLPLRLMAARYGWRTPLGTCLPRLCCEGCRRRPDHVLFVDNPGRINSAPGGGTPAQQLMISIPS